MILSEETCLWSNQLLVPWMTPCPSTMKGGGFCLCARHPPTNLCRGVIRFPIQEAQRASAFPPGCHHWNHSGCLFCAPNSPLERGQPGPVVRWICAPAFWYGWCWLQTSYVRNWHGKILYQPCINSGWRLQELTDWARKNAARSFQS